ncbi:MULTISPECIES: alpha/beta fold hydrolase [Halomonadaceae]|uniref:alpha/beta fold hydrolase n=1 Tax=Halomonadaceae TaxID=28256 RepID=UPI00159A5153|nr:MULTISPECIES: alpha/beta hydrolase [Halomonas]QJQ93855.1 alpha/beta hydrolase [Halomonas sp. PA5]
MQAEQASSERYRQMYRRGTTTVFSCRQDPRFSYCLYVPQELDQAPHTYTLLVAVHGTGRTMNAYRDAFAEFAEYHRCVVLAPLFPVGPCGDGEPDGYKYIIEDDIRYDRVMLAIIDEVAEELGIDVSKFLMFGYSGGGHFCHRFLYLHPERLLAASIGAPGAVTLLDDKRDWWVGTRDFAQVFGHPVNLAAMRDVAIQLVVGAADLETWEINHAPGSRRWREGINDAGATRIDRNNTLLANLQSHGMQVEQSIVPNVPHDGMKVLPEVKGFFKRVLQAHLKEHTA